MFEQIVAIKDAFAFIRRQVAAQEREVGGDGEFEVTRHVTHTSREETSAGAACRGKAPRERARSAARPCPRRGNSRARGRPLRSTTRLRCVRVLPRKPLRAGRG